MDKETAFKCLVSWGCGIMVGIMILAFTGNICIIESEQPTICNGIIDIYENGTISITNKYNNCNVKIENATINIHNDVNVLLDETGGETNGKKI